MADPAQPVTFLTGTGASFQACGAEVKAFVSYDLVASVPSLGLCFLTWSFPMGNYWHFVGDNSSLSWTLQEV